MDVKPIFPGKAAPFVIAGPCSAESREQVLEAARRLSLLPSVTAFRAGVWKPRTHPGGFEGHGGEALEWLRQAKAETGLPVATEVATASHIEACLRAGIDILWLGARTSGNPFAVQEIADALRGTDVAVLIKNPISPDLELWAGAIERIYGAGIRRIAAVHRGFSTFGGTSQYRNAPLWTIPLQLSVRYPELPVIHDPSHVGGRRNLIEPLARQALDTGFSGLIIESHCHPDEALSDAAQQITPERLGEILGNVIGRRRSQPTPHLEKLRAEIDAVDSELLDVLARRMAISRNIGEYKRNESMSVLQASRFNDLIADRCKRGSNLGLSDKFLKTVFNAIHDESVATQLRIIDRNPE